MPEYVSRDIHPRTCGKVVAKVNALREEPPPSRRDTFAKHTRRGAPKSASKILLANRHPSIGFGGLRSVPEGQGRGSE